MTVEGIGNQVTEFETGAVRDVQETKGRCDLMPLDVVADLITTYENSFMDLHRLSEYELKSNVFKYLNDYIYIGRPVFLLQAICNFIVYDMKWCEVVEHDKVYEALLDVSLLYKQGLEKYGERNWEKGIPLHSYIDSATRHFIKYLAHYKDEAHNRAFIWNLLCCIHTQKFIENDKLMDLPFYKQETPKDNLKDENLERMRGNHLGWITPGKTGDATVTDSHYSMIEEGM